MTFTKEDKDILEKIVVKEGDCLNGNELCLRCPFRPKCLSKFLNRTNPTTGYRLTKALDALGDDLLEDDSEK